MTASIWRMEPTTTSASPRFEIICSSWFFLSMACGTPRKLSPARWPLTPAPACRRRATAASTRRCGTAARELDRDRLAVGPDAVAAKADVPLGVDVVGRHVRTVHSGCDDVTQWVASYSGLTALVAPDQSGRP